MLNLRPLPPEARQLLDDMHAPPRLVAHLTLVHDMAVEIVEQLDAICPQLLYDREAVFAGAALHDIGKALHANELEEPGDQHERAGEVLLLAHEVPAHIARFARTHALPFNGEDAPVEDCLVALADNIWRGRRDQEVESALISAITRQTGEAQWQIYSALDDMITEIASGADERLAWQARFPTTSC